MINIKLGDTMNLLSHKLRETSSPESKGKHKMYSKETPQNKLCLDDFIGKFRAYDKMNCVNIKKDFKKGEF